MENVYRSVVEVKFGHAAVDWIGDVDLLITGRDERRPGECDGRNAHLFYVGGDSRDNGTMLAYRYRKTVARTPR